MISDEMIIYSLMRAAGNLRRKPHQESGGHRHGGFARLLELIPYEEGISQRDLAQSAGIRPQSLSEAAARLEERGYIRRETSGSDKRSVTVFITEEGARHREEVIKARRISAEKYLSVLTDDEKSTLFELLKKLTDAERE